MVILSRKISIEIGKPYFYLTVVSQADRGKSGDKQWNCLCVCGKNTIATSSNLDRGAVKSCGCKLAELVSSSNQTHGMSESRTYSSWKCMIQRCTNENQAKYYRYGGAGVKVCYRWNSKTGGSFLNFLEDMGERPEGTSLNRIHGAKLYSKETCEWASYSVQAFDQKVPKNNTSGRVGVTWSSKREMWQAQIRVDKKNINLGHSADFNAAVKLRENAELKYFGFIKG